MSSCCGCDSSNGSSSGCCSIAGTVPSGVPVRLEFHLPAAGVPAGAEVPVYRAEDGSVTPLTITSEQRLWIYWISVICEKQTKAHLYYGSSVSADSSLNSTVVRGSFSDDGGIVATLPVVPLSKGSKVYIKTSAALGQVDVVGYGVLETT